MKEQTQLRDIQVCIYSFSILFLEVFYFLSHIGSFLFIIIIIYYLLLICWHWSTYDDLEPPVTTPGG